MFEIAQPPDLDKIIQLMGIFKADPREGKVDLGVGVYKTPEGLTPVMKAVKQAEERIWAAQDSKSYVGLAGDPAFLDAMRGLILGDSVLPSRVASVATPGGTGAVRQVLELVKMLTPDAQVWVSEPSWPNHAVIIDHLGLTRKSYRYYDAATGGVDRTRMMSDLADVSPGDLILLHGCCHNPTGADLTMEDWNDIAALCLKTGAIPFIDIAYQGFGDGLEEDAAGMRDLAAQVPEMFLAASCSKNFGLYRERVGMALVITGEGKPQEVAVGLLASMNRKNYSFPPDHGARVVSVILGDPVLCTAWRAELSEMRRTIIKNRKILADALRDLTGSDRFGFLAGHRGMFSRCGATADEVMAIRTVYGVYMVGDGRINVAGLTPGNIPIVAKALAEGIA
ncbi:MAG: aspartate/tyrosine/aromatic aminotransferase [Rhodobacteraceae bacterium]|nr:aspartate/tyrosine/aromatic aminotransferase [Paracoccaceae bacterium]